MAGSIHVAVRKAVIAGIANRLVLAEPDVSVTYGWQGNDDTAAREQIFTANARASHDVAGLKSGRNFRQEQMDFDIVILVLGIGEKPDETDDRAANHARVVEEFLADHKNNELGVPHLQWLIVTDYAANYAVSPQGGSVSEVTITARYNARLT